MKSVQSQTAAWNLHRVFLLSIFVAGCASDAVLCLYYPCAVPEAGRIFVTATDAPIGVAGLTMTFSGIVSGAGACTQGSDGTSVCHIHGGVGTYHVQLSAPGYLPATLDFTATGTSPGCNTCGHVDLQQRAVVLQPTP